MTQKICSDAQIAYNDIVLYLSETLNLTQVQFDNYVLYFAIVLTVLLSIVVIDKLLK